MTNTFSRVHIAANITGVKNSFLYAPEIALRSGDMPETNVRELGVHCIYATTFMIFFFNFPV